MKPTHTSKGGNIRDEQDLALVLLQFLLLAVDINGGEGTNSTHRWLPLGGYLGGGGG